MSNYKEQRRMNHNGEKGEERRRKTKKPEYSIPFSPSAPSRLVFLNVVLV
jgi:hypothetical protein